MKFIINYNIIIIIFVILIITNLYYNQFKSECKLKSFKTVLKSYENEYQFLINRDTLITNHLNTLGSRVSDIDYRKYEPLKLMDVKSGFTSSKYLTELELFKSLTADEQYNYMNMTRDQKRIKYHNILS